MNDSGKSVNLPAERKRAIERENREEEKNLRMWRGEHRFALNSMSLPSHFQS